MLISEVVFLPNCSSRGRHRHHHRHHHDRSYYGGDCDGGDGGYGETPLSAASGSVQRNKSLRCHIRLAIPWLLLEQAKCGPTP